MKVSLAYGKGHLEFKIPENNFGGLIRPRVVRERGGETKAQLEKALGNPMGETLESLSKDKNVCVLIEDDTRAEPHQEIIDSLTPQLGEASRVTFIIATGSHDPDTGGNQKIKDIIRMASEREGLNLDGIHINDCFSGGFVDLGTTTRGTPLHVNEKAIGSDLFVVGADMKNHYFAGYSNALKSFLPGICAYESIEANHSWALDPRSTFGIHPLHPDRRRRDNPLAKDMYEAVKMIAGDTPVFILAMVSSHGRLLWSRSGELETVTSEGIRKVDELTSFTVAKAKYVVVSPGGYPQDESLYYAQRALELTKNAIKDGGSVLLLAECENGIAPNPKARENFYDKLTMPLGDVLGIIKSRYKLYSHKAYKFAEMIKRLDKVLLYTSLDESIVEKAHLHKAFDPQSIIDGWVKDDPDEGILVFDDANKMAIYAE